mmetsp:Transcript_34150/g.71894  ORF Transcript_34150/g.71894 Transcript_34150/m.71894 type:complete len:107 (-) Transcript_34150:112-432(-)
MLWQRTRRSRFEPPLSKRWIMRWRRKMRRSTSTMTDDDEEKEESDPNHYTTTIHCGKEMFNIEDDDVFNMYMPDRLHPNAMGYKLWSHCLKRGLEETMDHAINLVI